MWCPTHGILALQGKLFDHYIYVAKGLHHSKAVKHMGLSSSHTRAKPYQNSKWGVSERNCHSRNGYSTCVRVTINSCVLKTSVDTVVYDYRILVYFNWLKCFWVWLDCEFVLHNVPYWTQRSTSIRSTLLLLPLLLMRISMYILCATSARRITSAKTTRHVKTRELVCCSPSDGMLSYFSIVLRDSVHHTHTHHSQC